MSNEMHKEIKEVGGHYIQLMMLEGEPFAMMLRDKRISLDDLETFHDMMKAYAQEHMVEEPVEEEEEVELDADGNEK